MPWADCISNLPLCYNPLVQYYEYALLGIIQGLTEFLPVSSSGHLVLAQKWLGMDNPGVLVEIALHVATLVSVVLVYRHDLLKILRSRNWAYIWHIIIATLVTVAIVLPLKSQFEAAADGPVAVRLSGAMLLVTAIWLFIADNRLLKPPAPGDNMTQGRAVLAGIAQAVAALPGISRSGATIGTLVLLGEDRAAAARFSFLMSIPVILGAGVIKAVDLPRELASGDINLTALLLGFVLALISGIVAIHLVLWMLQRARLKLFSVWCLMLGTAALIIG